MVREGNGIRTPVAKKYGVICERPSYDDLVHDAGQELLELL